MGHLKEVLRVIVRFRVIERGDVNWHDGVHNIFTIYSTFIRLFGFWIDFDNAGVVWNSIWWNSKLEWLHEVI